jgi:2-polyprenyl-6-hydroxyphenyl methylase/3-demethylubiquinone-9 3-methyltransferase
MHHIPWDLHTEFLRQAKNALTTGACVIMKDWERRPNLVHLACYVSDRYITGDKVRYKTADEFRALIRDAFGIDSIKDEARIRPWRNNMAFLVNVS